MLKKLFNNKGIVTILSIAVCIIILFFAYRYRVDSAIDAIDVPVAKRTIEAREKITSDDIKTIKVAKSMISGSVITSIDKLVEKYVNYNTFIPEGSLFYKTAVVDWKTMPDSTWADIQDCSTIVSLSVNNNTTFGNSIFPGDVIDLWIRGVEGEKQFVGAFMEGIKVLAVKDTNGNHIFKKTANQAQAAALIFNVKDDYDHPENSQHMLLRKALNGPGEVFPVPRNINYGDSKENKEVVYPNKKVIDYVNRNVKLFAEDEKDIKCSGVLNSSPIDTTPITVE